MSPSQRGVQIVYPKLCTHSRDHKTGNSENLQLDLNEVTRVGFVLAEEVQTHLFFLFTGIQTHLLSSELWGSSSKEDPFWH